MSPPASSPDSARDNEAAREALRAPMAGPSMRIGLLGGSFNPAHEAHREISLIALKRLALNQVWWLVSSGNPLKDNKNLPSLPARVAGAKIVANDPRIIVTGFDGGTGSPYTADLLRAFKKRYRSVHFVWLMGADNLAQFHRWGAWAEIFKLVPIAVLDRPGHRLRASASPAAQRFSRFYKDETDAGGLALMRPPAWTILAHPLSELSSSALRKTVLKSD